MNKFCKSSLCVEKVRESYALIGRRVVVDRLGVLLVICVILRLCRLLTRPLESEEIRVGIRRHLLLCEPSAGI